MDDLAILQERHARNFPERLALRIIRDGEIEFLAADKIDLRTVAQRFFRKHADVRTDKRNLDVGIFLLNRPRQTNIAGESGSRREQHKELIVLGDLDSLLARNMVRRRVKQPRALQHSSRIRQPHRVPVTLNFAGGGPTGACASVEVFKRRGI